MFANFLQLFGRKPDRDYDQAFVQGVEVVTTPLRSRRLERLLWLGWVLIVLKSILVWWACAKYAVPINPLWVILPTVLMGLLCSLIYYARR